MPAGESVIERPAFRYAMQRRRCLFPADGFYEWRQEGSLKRPYFVRPRSGGPVAFAGLWETWMGPNGEEMETAAIVTTRANQVLTPIHDRMPVVIPPEAFDFWLDCRKVDAETAAALIVPAPDDLMEAYEVSPAVNKVANNSPELIEPVTEATRARAESERSAQPKVERPKRKDDDQLTLL